MEWEYKQLRVEYAGCQKSLRICRKKLAAERNNFRKLILAVSDRLEQSSLAVKQVRCLRKFKKVFYSTPSLNLF
jgi:hypothetical protein